jgi:hypothetical protein
MRATIVALALLVPALRQDQPDLLKSCEALFDRLSSLNPDDRAKAQAELVKLTSGKREFLKTPIMAPAQVTLALLGDEKAAKEVVKILAEDPGPLTRIAAEAIGRVGPDAASDRLLKLLEHEDLKTAMAAARSLSRAKGAAAGRSLQQMAESIEKVRRKVLAHYALELDSPGHLPTLFAQADSAQQPVREAAWAALANLPSAADDIRKRLREKDVESGYRTLFEGQMVSDDVRDAFGRQLVRAGVYVGPDLVELATHKIKEISDWARQAAVDPALMRKCVLLSSLIRRLAAYDKEPDEKKDPIPALEAMLEAQGVQGEGEKLKDRLEACRSAWDRMRPGILDKDVNIAIDLGVAQLRSRQLPDGSWKYCICGSGNNETHNNGTTALAIYTLLKCDASVREKAVTSGLDWLLGLALPNHTYTVSLQAMAFAEAIQMLTPPPKAKIKIPPDDLAALNKYIPRLRDCATWLVEAQTHVSRGGYESGDWDYQKPPATGMDNSNTQFAVLGLRAAQNAGVPIPERVWAKSLNHWVLDQNKDGSWPYRKDKTNPNAGGSRSMSAAGLYCSLVAKASLKRKDPVLLTGEEPFKKGLEHVKKDYPVPELAHDRSPGHVHSPYYDLYSLERAMMVSKIEKLADRDWYREGALFILGNQGVQGEWIDATDTCFALLFLKKAFVAVATGDK